MLANLELVCRLVLDAALGSVIGFERERLSWVAGLRTHMLVMQQSDDVPECDELMIVLHRVSNTEYEAICARLRQLQRVKQFRQDEVSS